MKMVITSIVSKQMDERRKITSLLGRKVDMFAMNVTSRTQLRQIFLATNKHIEVWKESLPDVVSIAAKHTFPCRLWPCIFWPINFCINVMCVKNPSAVPGYFKAICVVTPVKGLSFAMSAANRLPTAPIFGPTCKPIRLWSSTNARTVIERSLWNPISTSMPSLLVLENWQAKRDMRQMTRIKE